MLQKIVFAGILVAFICVQIAASLQCFQCGIAIKCDAPKLLNCKNQLAIATANVLMFFESNVTKSNSSNPDFECLHVVYETSLFTKEYRGCVFKGSTKALQPKKHFTRTKWELCDKDGCNKNPAGTINSSGATILSTLLGLLMLKIYS